VNLPLFRRRDLLKNLLRAPRDPLRLSPVLQARSDQILRDGAHARLEGVVGKRLVSIYEPGERSGAWIGGAFRLLDLGQLQYVLNKPNRFLFVMEAQPIEQLSLTVGTYEIRLLITCSSRPPSQAALILTIMAKPLAHSLPAADFISIQKG
jgi:hypothetical protein